MNEEVVTAQVPPTWGEIVSGVKNIVIDHLCIEEDDKGYDLTFPFESFGADDLDHSELIMKTEEQFGVEFDDAECANIKCTFDLIHLVAETLGVEPSVEPGEETVDEESSEETLESDN